MVEFYILKNHAAAALGIEVSQLNLPRCGYGVDADALWVDPRFIEVRRSRAAVARQMAEHRVNFELHRTPRAPEEGVGVQAPTRSGRCSSPPPVPATR
jgi:hypothetical protein